MATGDTVLTDTSLRAHPDGLALALQLPWYRSLWLSSVSDVQVTVDGTPVPREALRVELSGRSFRVAELPEQWDVLWFVQDRLVVVVPLDVTPADRSYDVEATVDLRLPYMQIAPGTYVRNRVTNRRTLEPIPEAVRT